MTGSNTTGNTVPSLVLIAMLVVLCVVVYHKPGVSDTLPGLMALAGLLFFYFDR